MNLAAQFNFNILDVGAIVVSFLGVILHVLVVNILFKKFQKNYGTIVVGYTSLAFLLYFIGNFLAVFTLVLVTEAAVKIYLTGWVISLVGFAFIPSLLIHTYGNYYHTKDNDSNLLTYNRIHNILFSILHLIGVYFIIGFILMATSGLDNNWPIIPSNININHMNLFTVWIAISCAVSGVYSLKLVHLPRWRRYQNYFYINGIFLLILSVASIFTLWNLNLTYTTTPIFRLLFLTIALYHGLLLAYFRVRYHFITVFVRPSIVYVLLAGIVVLIYQFGVRNISKYLSQFPVVNVQFVELLLLMGLIVLFHPVRVRLQNRVNALFFKETKIHRNIIHKFSQQLKSSLSIKTVLSQMSSQLQNTLNVERFKILLMSNPKIKKFTAIISFFDEFTEPVLFNHNCYGNAYDEFIDSGYEMIVAVRDENVIWGFICVGSKLADRKITANEVHLIKTLANQLAVYIRNAELVEERLTLQRKIIEQEKFSSLGQIATSITHDVKNPLSAMNTLVQVMQEELPRGDDLKHDLKTIEREISHLNRILSGIVKYAGRESTDFQPVGVDEVLEDVLILLRKEAQLNDVNIELKSESNVKIMGTLHELKEVLFNLVFNAIQACSEAGGTVWVETSVIGKNVAIIVKDSGPGIMDDKLTDIFKPFYTTKKTGVGLGLSIVKEKVSLMNGEISIRNHSLGGAEFKIILPII
ncbi:MAG: hypothetical protein IIB44_10960 [Candidatus Marinimicrobia bacterium]|nr:hypothetical protein [Candidatus Neomarinimicrobiota bacterium]